MLVADKKITRTEYLDRDDFEEGFQYELISGTLVKKQAPSPQHQLASGNFYAYLHRFNREKQIGGICLAAPIDVFLSELDVFQPDILFVRKERLGIVTEHGIEGAPDLVVEILSPSTFRYDRNEKMKTYGRAGVPEYWIVDPRNRSIEVFALENGVYELFSFAIESGSVASKVLEGFVIGVDEVLS